MANNTKIIFRNGISEIDEYEMSLKGYRNDVEVTFPNNNTYHFCFYDSVRLSQDIETEKYILEENLIILEKVNVANIHYIISKIWTTGQYKKYKIFDEW
ncbi:MAG: hypothetical protein ACXVPQ_10830 [Bacteroidia bacterium]